MGDETKYLKAYLCLERDCGCLFRSEHDGALCPDCEEQTRADITPVAFEKIRAHFVAEYLAGLGSAKWFYRYPAIKGEDWGVVRDEEGHPVCTCSVSFESEETLLAHRKAGTDPTAKKAKLIAHAPSMAAEIEQLRSEIEVDKTVALVLKARQEMVSFDESKMATKQSDKIEQLTKDCKYEYDRANHHSKQRVDNEALMWRWKDVFRRLPEKKKRIVAGLRRAEGTIKNLREELNETREYRDRHEAERDSLREENAKILEACSPHGECEMCRQPLPEDDAVRDCLKCGKDGCIRCIKDNLCVPCAVAEIEKLREEINERSKREWLPDSPLAGCGALCAMCAKENGDDINEMWNEISWRRADCDTYGNEIDDLEKSNKELLAALRMVEHRPDSEDEDTCPWCQCAPADRSSGHFSDCKRQAAIANAETLQQQTDGK